MALAHNEVGARLGADADPVEPLGRSDGVIGFDADGKAARMQRVDQRTDELQHRLAASQHQVAVDAFAAPLRGNGIGKLVRRTVAAAKRTVGAYEIGVVELTYCACAILLPAAPETAAGEAAEHG